MSQVFQISDFKFQTEAEPVDYAIQVRDVRRLLAAAGVRFSAKLIFDLKALQGLLQQHLRDDSAPRVEVPLKTWCHLEAERTGCSPVQIMSRFQKNQLPNLKVRRVNQRVVFVTAPEHSQFSVPPSLIKSYEQTGRVS